MKKLLFLLILLPGLVFGFAPKKPIITGIALPPNCTLGDVYFLLGVTEDILYGCTAFNTWTSTAISAGGGGGGAGTGTCAANQYEIADTGGGPTCAQVAFTDLSGTASDAQVNGSLEADEVNPTLGSQTQGNYVATVATTAPLAGGAGGSEGTAISLTTSMSTNRLIGRTTAGAGVMEEITVASPLTFVAGILDIASIADGDLASNYSGIGTCTNQYVSVLNDNAAPTCTTDVLASAYHANQGTTTQVLHGNAAGNPAWGAVALGTDTSGNYVKDVADGTGIDGTAAGVGATFTPTLDLTEITCTGPISCPAATTITTSMNTARLLGRTTAAAGVVEEITVASPLTFSAGVLDVSSIADSDLASNYSGIGACGANTWASSLNDNAAPTCTQPAFTNISGSVTDGQVPDDITISGTDKVSLTAIAGGADDQFLVSNGTDWQVKSLADCDNAGNAVNYDVATNALSCKTMADSDIPDDLTISTTKDITIQTAHKLCLQDTAGGDQYCFVSEGTAPAGTTTLTMNVDVATCSGDGNGGALTVNGSNEIVCSADNGGGGSTPTGTGFRHVTSGTEDAASVLLDFTAAAQVAANQGTTITLLHGNAAGQASFAAVTEADGGGPSRAQVMTIKALGF